jgi:MarR family 2-MHQ and catechol resistance regulon transcriptional repressor
LAYARATATNGTYEQPKAAEAFEGGPAMDLERVYRTAEMYAAAYPDADLRAMLTHLHVVSAGAAVSNGLMAHLTDAGFDITRPRFTLLRLLYLASDNRLAQTEIAREMGVSSANVTQLIDSLEREGWVERTVNPSDRRVTYARLTPNGEAKCAVLIPTIREFMEQSCSALDPAEQEQLQRLLTKVRRHMKARYSYEAL